MTTPVMVALVRVCNEANYGVPHDEVWVARACLELDDLRAFFEKYTALQQLYATLNDTSKLPTLTEKFFGIKQETPSNETH